MSARVRSWADFQGRLALLLFRGFQQGPLPARAPQVDGSSMFGREGGRRTSCRPPTYELFRQK